MKKSFLGKLLSTIAVVTILVSSTVLAKLSDIPKFVSEKFGMRLGTTQSISSVINLKPSDYDKLITSDPSVIAIQPDGTLKARSTGLSKLSYTYINSEGEEEELYCYIEVSMNNSTYTEINGNTATKINITLELGDYQTVVESPASAIPTLPDVKKDGYVLEGWYKDAALTIKLGERDRFNKDTTLYAKWITKEESNKPLEFHSSLYNDIDSHWGRFAIETVSYAGLFNGVSEKMFGPDRTMTRAMVITVLGRLDDVELTGRTTAFEDVAKGSYYEEYVAWGLENKIVNGTTEATFSPNKEITREEMAVMMANYIKYKNYKYELKDIDFKDKGEISSWALESVKILNNLGIMQGNSEGAYNPKKVATRAEIATVFNNYLSFLNK